MCKAIWLISFLFVFMSSSEVMAHGLDRTVTLSIASSADAGSASSSSAVKNFSSVGSQSNSTRNAGFGSAKPNTAPFPVLLVCPKYTCSKFRNPKCVNKTLDGWVISRCPIGYECRFAFNNIDVSSCKLEKDNDDHDDTDDDDDDDDERCYTGYLLPGANCTAISLCQEGYFCDAVTSTCQARVARNSNCSQTNQCERDFVCNKGSCIPHFSVAVGNASDSSVACVTGIVRNGTCRPAQVTNGTLPKKCNSDSNCTATDGITPGVCRCGADLYGSAYCTTQRSDRIALQQIAATYNGNYEEIAYYTYKLNYFQIVLSEIVEQPYEDCLDEALDIEKYEVLEEMFEICSPKCRTGCFNELGLN